MKPTLLLLILGLSILSCRKNKEIQTGTNNSNAMCNIDSCALKTKEFNGVSFENVNYAIDSSHINPILDINASWVTTMPFGFVMSGDDSVQNNSSFQWVGETPSGVTDIINKCHSLGLKVMVKPHIWAINTWIGDLEYNTESEWQTFERSYINYIMEFAEISANEGAEAFCIGVEMKKFVINRPAFFETLIDTVRTVYSGPLTYASNWDNYQNVTFWDELDYIGIDAYFPVSSEQTPSFDDCYSGWESDFNDLQQLSSSFAKPIIFTEFGYRNVDHTSMEPWDESTNSTYNETAQNNAYQALFCRFWSQSWFAGGFFWKWHPNHNSAGGSNNNRFTPQNKTVEALIRTVYESTNP